MQNKNKKQLKYPAKSCDVIGAQALKVRYCAKDSHQQIGNKRNPHINMADEKL